MYSKSNSLLHEEMFVYFTWNYFNSTNTKINSSIQNSLLTMAVAKMAAMPACCGRSWISECSAAGYSGSSFTTGCFCVTRLSAGESWASEEEEESRGGETEAKSFSPAVSSLVTLQNSWSPANTKGWSQNWILTRQKEKEKRKKKKVFSFFVWLKNIYRYHALTFVSDGKRWGNWLFITVYLNYSE